MNQNKWKKKLAAKWSVLVLNSWKKLNFVNTKLNFTIKNKHHNKYLGKTLFFFTLRLNITLLNSLSFFFYKQKQYMVAHHITGTLAY